MLKEAIEKIVSLAAPSTYEIQGETYADRSLEQIRPEIDEPLSTTMHSLEGIVKVLTEEIDLVNNPVFVQVRGYDCVEVYTAMDISKRYKRQCIYTAIPSDVPGWEPETKMPFEQAAIALQTRFQESPDRGYALQLLSQITCGGKVTYNDNGIATNVVTQKGIQLQEQAAIRPLIKLRPYRTFQEVDQPESMFLIRIDERGISFIEADGGMWKLTARATIKKYFEDNLSALIDGGKVVVTI